MEATADAPGFDYSPNTRQRIWRDAETGDIIRLLAARYATAWHTPVIKLALRHLREHEPRTRLLDWIKATAKKQGDCTESSWNGTDEDMEIVRAAAEAYELTHTNTLRLAIRQLAEHEGLVPLAE